MNAAPKANQEVLFSKVAQQVGHFDNPWLLFSKYIDAVNENCTKQYCQNGKVDLAGHGTLRQLIVSQCQRQKELILLSKH